MLHAFQKKAKKGIKTPKQDINLIKKRLQSAEQHRCANDGTARKALYDK